MIKKISFIFLVILIILLPTITYCEFNKLFLVTQKEKLSYSIGVDIGKGFKMQGVDLDLQVLLKGITDAYSGGKTLLSEKEISEILTNYQKDMIAKQSASISRLAEKNKKDGEVFLAKNKKGPGVKTLPSGLQYKELKAGTGKRPTANDTVVVHYRGTFLDGTEFDSSYKRGQPAIFPVSGVIPGWTEALQLMKVGAKWQLFIPSNLAYGERGGGPIGPNAVLIFEVELVAIK